MTNRDVQESMRARPPLRIGWVGSHVEGIGALEALIAAGTAIEAVITLTEAAGAKRSGAVDYGPLCRRFGIPIYRIANINDSESLDLLRRLELDIVFVIGWSQIVRAEALALVGIGMIGAHASLLPRNRGRAPVNWALIRGERVTGNSLIWLDAEVDCGPIIDQTEIPLGPYDTCATVYERVGESNTAMILRVLPRLEAGERPGTPQVPGDEPLLPGRRPADGLVDWTLESGEVYNFVRALTRPYPGAFSFLANERWRIWNAALLPGPGAAGQIPGMTLGPVVSPIDGACGQAVGCGDGTLVLLEIESERGELLAGRSLSDREWSGMVWTND